MSLTGRLAALEKEHATLSKEIEILQASPGSDDLEIQSLKKKKLFIKEEIESLKSLVT